MNAAPRGRHRLAVALALALVLHGLVGWALRDAFGPRERQRPAPVQRMEVVWLPPVPRPPPITAPSSPHAPAPSARAAPQPPRLSALRKAPATSPTAPEPQTIATMPPAPAPGESAEAAPQALPGPGRAAAQFLESATSRRAAGQASTHTTSAAALAARDGMPAPRSDRWERGIQGAAKGDCAKGEFKGSHMGLLSLPMLAAAMASGECAR